LDAEDEEVGAEVFVGIIGGGGWAVAGSVLVLVLEIVLEKGGSAGSGGEHGACADFEDSASAGAGVAETWGSCCEEKNEKTGEGGHQFDIGSVNHLNS
jgi:hypothetical protein